MYHILNLVLYDKFLKMIDMLSGQKTERAIAHDCVQIALFLHKEKKGRWEAEITW